MQGRRGEGTRSANRQAVALRLAKRGQSRARRKPDGIPEVTALEVEGRGGERPGATVPTRGHFDRAGPTRPLADSWDVPPAHPPKTPYLADRADNALRGRRRGARGGVGLRGHGGAGSWPLSARRACRMCPHRDD